MSDSQNPKGSSDPAGQNYHIELQRTRYAEVFGHEIPASTMSTITDIFIALQGLYFADGCTDHFEDKQYWEDLSEGRLHVSVRVGETLDRYLVPSRLNRAAKSAADADFLSENGFCVQEMPCPVPQEVLNALADTTMRLREAGWPVTFLLVRFRASNTSKDARHSSSRVSNNLIMNRGTLLVAQSSSP
jgi:hypothetical protein